MELGGGSEVAGNGFGSGVVSAGGDVGGTAEAVAAAAEAWGELDTCESAVGLHAASSNTGSMSAFDRALARNRAILLRFMAPFAEL